MRWKGWNNHSHFLINTLIYSLYDFIIVDQLVVVVSNEELITRKCNYLLSYISYERTGVLSLLLAAHASGEIIGWSTIKCNLSLVCFVFYSYGKKEFEKKMNKKRIELKVWLTKSEELKFKDEVSYNKEN